MKFRRILDLVPIASNSFFLWGPRKCGKSFLLKNTFPQVPIIDLLRTDVLAEYLSRPALLRERFLAGAFRGADDEKKQIIIDEVQKAPALLDEVHWLIENHNVQCILSGSSARKLKRGQANLLGGRAWRRTLHPLTLQELRDASWDESLETIMVKGTMPSHLLSPDYREDMRGYIADYLKEEVLEEALVQNFPAFSAFLQVAAITNGELVNYTNIARDVGVSAKVVAGYFTILEDTLLGCRLAPWAGRSSRRIVRTERFYLFDVGVSNFLAKRAPARGTPEFGKSFEHLIFNELIAYKAYKNPDLDITFWRTDRGVEVDFVLNRDETLIEVKSSARVHETDLKGLSLFASEQSVKNRFLVCLESAPRLLRDAYGDVRVLPLDMFIADLWAGAVVSS